MFLVHGGYWLFYYSIWRFKFPFKVQNYQNYFQFKIMDNFGTWFKVRSSNDNILYCKFSSLPNILGNGLLVYSENDRENLNAC